MKLYASAPTPRLLRCTVGDILNTVGGYLEYRGGYDNVTCLKNGTKFPISPRIMCVQYRGGYLEYLEGYLEYRGDVM